MVIEHPEWMATQTHHSPDLYKGDDRGRIYRIVPESGLRCRSKLQLGQASDEELVAQLGNPNIWWRRTAQRLLLDRQSAAQRRAAGQAVRQPARPAVARLHALWTLAGLHKLDPELIAEGARRSRSRRPGKRHHPRRAAPLGLAALLDKLLAMEHDPDTRVRFQLLCTLGGVSVAGIARRAGPPAGPEHRRPLDAGRGVERVPGARPAAI